MIHEMRTYRAMPGRLADLNKRFETITIKIWERHGIRPLGFWTTLVGESNQDLMYLIEWSDLAERERKWNAFAADPEWLKARAETEKNGALVETISNQFLAPTAYSAIK